MTQHFEPVDRRTVLKAAAAVLTSGLAFVAPAEAQTTRVVPPGKPGDFDFLTGNWAIRHRRRKEKGLDVWDEFSGEATCWAILGGAVSVEELRIPARNFHGMGLRLLDIEKRTWNDFWVNGKSGVLTTPGQTGGFVDGVGTFTADDTDGDHPILVRGVWDQITPSTCRWSQAVSWDEGVNWEENWVMQWTRS